MVTVIYMCGSFLSLFGLIVLWVALKTTKQELTVLQELGMITVTLGISITFFFNIITAIMALVV